MTELCGVVDCEHHALVATLDDLLPYFDETTALRVSTSEFRLPPATPHPGVQVEGKGVEGGTDPVAVAKAIPESVAHVVLISAQSLPTPGWLDHGLAAAFGSAANALLVDRWLPTDPRFRLAIALAPHDADLAVDEIERHDGTSGVVAACLPLIAVSMGHKHYHPIYAALAERHLPLIVHPGGSEGEVLGAAAIGGTGPRTPEESFGLLPQVAQANLASLVFNGVFETYPELTVVFAGWGFEWVPTFLWRLDSEWRNLRVTVPWLTRPPSQAVADHVRFVVDAAASTGREGAWQHARLMPRQSLLYGSDVPFVTESVDTQLNAIPDDLRTAVARDNALTTFPRL